MEKHNYLPFTILLEDKSYQNIQYQWECYPKTLLEIMNESMQLFLSAHRAVCENIFLYFFGISQSRINPLKMSLICLICELFGIPVSYLSTCHDHYPFNEIYHMINNIACKSSQFPSKTVLQRYYAIYLSNSTPDIKNIRESYAKMTLKLMYEKLYQFALHKFSNTQQMLLSLLVTPFPHYYSSQNDSRPILFARTYRNHFYAILFIALLQKRSYMKAYRELNEISNSNGDIYLSTLSHFVNPGVKPHNYEYYMNILDQSQKFLISHAHNQLNQKLTKNDKELLKVSCIDGSMIPTRKNDTFGIYSPKLAKLHKYKEGLNIQFLTANNNYPMDLKILRGNEIDLNHFVPCFSELQRKLGINKFPKIAADAGYFSLDNLKWGIKNSSLICMRVNPRREK
jgi:hypothetical protein